MLERVILILFLLPSLLYAGDIFNYEIKDNYIYDYEKLIKEDKKSTKHGCYFFPSIKQIEYDIDIVDKEKTLYRIQNDVSSLFKDNILYSILYPFYICKF